MRTKLATVTLRKSTAVPAAKTKKAKRRIVDAKITHISLCGRGKNNMAVMLKSDGAFGMQMLTKAVGDELHAVVWVPEENGAAGIDAEGDVSPAAVVKRFAHNFVANMVKEGGGIDIDHDQQVLDVDQVRLAETFIVQKGDPRFAGWKDNDGTPVDVTGAWAVILKLLDPTLIALAAKGDLGGVSMFGRAQVEILKADLTVPPTSPTPTDSLLNMNDEQMQKLAEMIAKAMKPSGTGTPAPATSVAFEGDPMNAEDVAKHADRVLLASLDMSKPADVLKWQQHVAKRQTEMKKAQEAIDAAAAAEAAKNPNAKRIAELEKQLVALRKGSGASEPAPGGDAEPAPETGLSKSEADLLKAGKSLAQRFQKREKVGA